MLLALLMAAQATSAPAANLSVFKPFLGSCWRAQFSATVHDTHCFDAMYGGAHVRDRHEVRNGSKVIYAGETIYSADGPDLVFTYFNSLGGVGLGKVGTATGMLGFTGTMLASPDQPEQAIDSEWKIIDVDHYQVRSLVKTPATGSNPTLTFARVKP
jgi:hypothetical protein